jgi:hypothetical protein
MIEFILYYLVGSQLAVCAHYQKTDKYKWKYRGNISVGKFRDFTDGHIPSVYTEGITEG